MDVGEIESFEKNSLGKNVRKRLEIDFVVHRGRAITYIQVAYRIDSPEKQDQEFASFCKLSDSFKKSFFSIAPSNLGMPTKASSS